MFHYVFGLIAHFLIGSYARVWFFPCSSFFFGFLGGKKQVHLQIPNKGCRVKKKGNKNIFFFKYV